MKMLETAGTEERRVLSNGGVNPERATIEFRAEAMRKGIHLVSLSIPVIYYFISRELALQLLVPMTVASFLIEYGRFYHGEFSTFFYKLFRFMLRNHELDERIRRLTGATYVLLAASLCVLIFPKVIVLTSFAILIVSDSSSALFGRRFGKTRFFNKSLEGATAFFLSAVVVVMLAPKITSEPAEYAIGIVAAAFGAALESMSLNIDDNLVVPIGIGFILWGLYALMLPGVNVYALM